MVLLIMDPDVSLEGKQIETLVNRLENPELFEKFPNLCVEPFS